MLSDNTIKKLRSRVKTLFVYGLKSVFNSIDCLVNDLIILSSSFI